MSGDFVLLIDDEEVPEFHGGFGQPPSYQLESFSLTNDSPDLPLMEEGTIIRANGEPYRVTGVEPGPTEACGVTVFVEPAEDER